MKAQYLVRFDDICPGMNWDTWNQIESLCLQHEIKPILAVIPDNRDPEFNHTSKVSAETFWRKVREWQARGWPIALHGYQHLYSTPSSGILKLNSFSEFAGLDEVVQTEKIKNALAIFAENGVRADMWIAPGHSFDEVTLKVLKKFDINTICDGFFLYPFLDRNGFKWIPQQLWKFRPIPFGLWTVCFHHDKWTEADIALFSKDISSYTIACYWDILANRTLLKTILNHSFAQLYRLARRLKELRKRLN